jgi:hypothetical protein
MKLDCNFHCHDERLRRWIRQLAPDEIQRLLKPLGRVQMATKKIDFLCVTAGVLQEQHPASAEAKLT